MGMLEYVGVLVGGLIVLLVGGEFLVRGATNIAYSLQISPLVVGLTIVAFGTSAPELVISIDSALSGSPDLSVGNVIGSNICNLSLVLGVTALVFPIIVRDNSIKIDWLMTMGSSLLLFFFVSKNQKLEHFEGVIFVIILSIYTYFLIEMSRRETREKLREEQGLGDDEDIPSVSGSGLFKEIAFLVIGCIGLVFGGDWFVSGAKGIATDLGIEERIVGLTVVALGTSLPELVTSAIAAFKKNTDLALGNLLGSCIFNNLSILGITAIIKEIPFKEETINKDMMWMMGIMMLVLPMMISRRKIGKVEGILLIVAYCGYVYWLVRANAIA